MRTTRFIVALVLSSVACAQDSGDELLSKANAAYRSVNAAEAVRLYRHYLATHSDRADVRVFLGGALLNLNELEAAFDEAGRAIAINGRYAKAYILAGRICAAREQWDRAQKYFEKAQALDGNDAEAWYFAGRAAFDATRFEPAIAAFERALRTGTQQSRVYENLGLALDALGRFGEAESAFRKAVGLAAGAWRPYLSYGGFLFRQSRAQESLRVLRQALALAPAETSVRFELARVLYHENDLDEAASVLEPARSTRECRVHNLLVRIYSVSGRSNLADAEAKAIEACAAEPGHR